MDAAVEQQQPRRIPSLRIITVVGYVVLMVAIQLTGQMAGYSDDTTVHLIDHILAKSFILLLCTLLVWGLLGKSMFARWTRPNMDKSHLGTFAVAALVGGVGMVVMAQHGSPDIQNWCFDFLSGMLGWSMGLEYLFAAYRKPDA